MLPRVMLKHIYNFSNLLPSCLCSAKFSGQAPAPRPLFKPAPCSYTFAGICWMVYSVELRARCRRVNDKSVGKRERRKFRYRGNNVAGPLFAPTHTEWFRRPSFGKRRPRLTPTELANEAHIPTRTSRLNSSHTLMNFGGSFHKRIIIYSS
jgi:hypothetical protein